MRAEDLKIGETVTVRPAVRGIARFDGVVLGTVGKSVVVQRGEKKESWAVGAHEVEPYDGLTDFQREVRDVAHKFKAIPVADVIAKIGGGVNESSVGRAARSYPLSNFVEIKRTVGKNRKERVAILHWREP